MSGWNKFGLRVLLTFLCLLPHSSSAHDPIIIQEAIGFFGYPAENGKIYFAFSTADGTWQFNMPELSANGLMVKFTSAFAAVSAYEMSPRPDQFPETQLRFLLSLGFPMETKIFEYKKFSGLEAAALAHDLDLVKEIVKRQKHISAKDINLKDVIMALRPHHEKYIPDRFSTLMAAKPEIIRLLIMQGADVNEILGSPTDITPLTLATEFRDLNSMRVLIENGANPDIKRGREKSARETAEESPETKQIMETVSSSCPATLASKTNNVDPNGTFR